MDRLTNPTTEQQARAWHGFHAGRWQTAIDLRDFIVRNVTAYEGDDKFLVGPSALLVEMAYDAWKRSSNTMRNVRLEADRA